MYNVRNMPKCPVCGEKLNIPLGLPPGEFITCQWCNSDIEIISIDPYELKKAPPIEDSWGE